MAALNKDRLDSNSMVLVELEYPKSKPNHEGKYLCKLKSKAGRYSFKEFSYSFEQRAFLKIPKDSELVTYLSVMDKTDKPKPVSSGTDSIQPGA
jgi:hypothetical protein